MSWTYNAASLSTSDRYKVRLIIGDNDSTRQQLQDEEIDYVLTEQTDVNYASAACCDLLSSKYAFLCNTENSALRISAAARHKHYQELADRLRDGGPGDVPGGDGAGTPLATMYVGGAEVSAKETLISDTDLVSPVFRLGQDDNPGVDGGADSDVLSDF